MNIRNLTCFSFLYWKELVNAEFWNTSVFGHPSSRRMTKEDWPNGNIADNQGTLNAQSKIQNRKEEYPSDKQKYSDRI
jgi:hypothetical protein